MFSLRNFINFDPFVRLIAKQSWIRFALRDYLLRKYCNPDTAAFEEFEIDFFGKKYCGTLSNYIDWCVFFYGAYEKQNLLMYEDLLSGVKGRPVVLDIGANVGHHSLFFSRFAGEIHCFEPNPKLFAKLLKKINLNNLENVSIHEFGMGNEEQSLQYYEPVDCNQGTGSFISDHATNTRKGKMLKVVRADDYLGKLNLPKIDLIKIDVEGFEYNVLKGLKASLCKYLPIVIFEFSGNSIRPVQG